jgi:hypothetical protein
MKAAPKTVEQCSKDSFVDAKTSTFYIKFCCKNAALRVAAKILCKPSKPTVRPSNDRKKACRLKD